MFKKNVTNQGKGALGTGIYLWVEMLNLSTVPFLECRRLYTPNQLNKILL